MAIRVHLPSLDGATTWLNSDPLRAEDLRGRVVLVDFWTLTCINWLRTVPHVRAWWRAYRDDGLLVLGVHTPEFTFEHDVDGVRRATAEREIDYPVAVDNNYEVWSAFDNHYWPALYFVDADGVIRDQHFGEGRYDESERLLQRLLSVDRPPAPVDAGGVEAEADWDHLRTHETYLGYQRGERFASSADLAVDRMRRYRLPGSLRHGQWALEGEWAVGGEKVLTGGADSAIAFRFHARDAHLVLSRGTAGPIPFRVLLDGEPPGQAHGVDVDSAGNGVLDEGRLYQLVREPGGVRERTLQITFSDSGAEAYAFTFG